MKQLPFLLLASLGIAQLSVSTLVAQVTSFEVTTLADELDATSTAGSGVSLREAIRDAEAGNGFRSITFQDGLSGRIELERGELSYNDDSSSVLSVLSILGPESVGDEIILVGNGTERHLTVGLGARLVIEGLTFVEGRAEGGGFEGSSGGSILNQGFLSLESCTFRLNSASAFGGAISNSLDANLGVAQSSFEDNQAASQGGAIVDFGAGCNVRASTFARNQANGGGAFASSNGSDVTITTSTFFGNVSSSDGGALRTVGTVDISNCTIVGNSATTGGGIAAVGIDTTQIRDSILSQNSAENGESFSGSLFFPAGNGVLGANPMLAPLGFYGGPTQTMHPLAGSPAILTGQENTTRIDQRGFTFTGPPTIGAVQLGPITTVDTTDSGSSTLRDALSNSADTAGQVIRFASSLNGETITLSSSELEVPGTADGLFIDASNLSDGLTIDAAGSAALPRRVLRLQEGATAALHSVILTGGRTADGEGDFGANGGNGGGIFVDNNGTLTLSSCTVSGNTTGGGGEGGFGGFGGGIFVGRNGILTLSSCSVTGNTTGDGGDASLGGFGGGIFVETNGILTLSSCTVSGNTTGDGGNGGNGGSGGSGGGIGGTAGISLALSSCTVSDNQVSSGGRGSGISFFSARTFTIFNSIVAGNIPNGADDQIRGTPNEEPGENLLSGDPLLAPLGFYGGPTQTMPPLADSPAIDAGGSSNPGGRDQRGLPRVVGGVLDIGAVEFQGLEEELDRAFDIDIDQDGTSVGVELAIGTNPSVADAGDPRNLSISLVGASNEPSFDFGVDPDEEDNIILRLMRSTDLINFDVEVLSNAANDFPISSTFSDSTPPAGRAFYRLEAERRPIP